MTRLRGFYKMDLNPLYLRKYTLVVGTPRRVTQPQSRTFDPNDPASTYRIDQLFPGTIPPEVQESRVLEFTELHFEAYIPQNKTRKATSRDKGYIKVYNMNKEHRDFILTDTQEKLVFLYAGYENQGDLPLIFAGELITAEEEKQGHDTILSMTCGQSVRVGADIRVQKTYRAGDSFAAILNDLLQIASDNGIDIGRARLPPGEGQFYQNLGVVQNVNNDSIEDLSERELRFINRALPVEGYLLDILSKVAQMVGYRSYMVLNRLYVEPEDFPRLFEIVEVNTSQIQESIRPSVTSKTDRTNSNKAAEIMVKLFLNGEVTANKRLRILDGEYEGLYQITKVEHHMRLEKSGKDTWTTSLIAREIP